MPTSLSSAKETTFPINPSKSRDTTSAFNKPSFLPSPAPQTLARTAFSQPRPKLHLPACSLRRSCVKGTGPRRGREGIFVSSFPPQKATAATGGAAVDASLTTFSRPSGDAARPPPHMAVLGVEGSPRFWRLPEVCACAAGISPPLSCPLFQRSNPTPSFTALFSAFPPPPSRFKML